MPVFLAYRQGRGDTLDAEDKETSWSNQLEVLQEDLAEMSKERTRLQKENRNHQSQSASLLAQIHALGPGHSNLKMDARRAATRKRVSKDHLNLLLAEQARLQRLYDQLRASNLLHTEYSKLEVEVRRAATSKEAGEDELANRARLQRWHDQLQADYKDQTREGKEIIMSKCSRLRDDLRRAKEAIKQEGENPKMDKKILAYLLSEHSKLRDDFRSFFIANEGRKTEYFNLQNDYKSLRMETLNSCLCHQLSIKEPAVKERAVKKPACRKLGACGQGACSPGPYSPGASRGPTGKTLRTGRPSPWPTEGAAGTGQEEGLARRLD